MKKFFCISLLILLLGSTNVFANVFAFDISVDTSTGVPKISYRLNDNASSVDIEVFGPLPGTTVIDTIAGGTAKGLNIEIWDGAGSVSGQTYGFKITAYDAAGYGDWTIINSSGGLIFDFEYPRGGVIVNNNQKSPYFGMIYVSNTRSATTVTGRTTESGIYALYPDGTDTLAIGDTAKTGGVDWSLSTYSSPYKMFVNSDDKLWIADWSDSHSGVWLAEPDLSGSFTEILSPTAPDAINSAGRNSVHGSVAGVFVEGTGSSTVLYTYDEDLPDETEPGIRNIYKYEIGTGPFPWTSAPTIAIDENNFSSHPLWDAGYGLMVNDSNGKIQKDSSGNWWVSNYRAAAGSACIMKFAPDGLSILWDDISGAGGTGNTPNILFSNLGGFAIDEANNRIISAFDASGINVFPFNPLPASDLGTQLTNVTGFNSNRGVAVDAAGNVYAISNTSERLTILSPPGVNSFDSETNLTLDGGQYVSASDARWALYE